MVETGIKMTQKWSYNEQQTVASSEGQLMEVFHKQLTVHKKILHRENFTLKEH